MSAERAVASEDQRSAAGFPLVALLLAVVSAAAILRIAALIPLAVPLDFNEGWNAYNAMRAISGQGLYPGPEDLIWNNYPPLSFYVVGALGTLLGDHLVAGRVVSLVAFILLAIGVGVAARICGCSRAEAGFSALCFTTAMVLFSHYVGIDDPQLLAHAVGIAGFLLVIGGSRGSAAVALGALLLTIALFIKHNLIAQPLALALWLAIYDRGAARRFVASGLGFLLIGGGACGLIFGEIFFTDVFAARPYDPAKALSAALGWLATAPAFLCSAAVLYGWGRNDKWTVLCGAYAAIAILIGICFMGGAGVDSNVMFDADIALAIIAGLALNRLAASRGVPPHRHPRLRTALAAVYLLPFSYALAVTPHHWLRPMAGEAAAARREIAFLRDHAGPALCEPGALWLCYRAGKTLPRLERHGELLALVAAQHFAVIAGDWPVSPGFRLTLDARYRPDHDGIAGTIRVPAQGSPPQSASH